MAVRRPPWAGRLVGLLALTPTSPAAVVRPTPACQVATDRIAVLVEFPRSGRFTTCVAVGGDGIDALERAGLHPVTSAYGTVGGARAVCALTHPGSGEQIGCASGPDCLTCLAPDYWQYFPGYRFSPVGGGSSTPTATRVEAWRWGRSQTWSGSRPSAATLCPAPATTTTTTTTSAAPTTTRPPAGTVPPGGGGTPPPSGTRQPGGGAATTAPTGGATTTAPDGSSTTAASTTTTAAAGADDDGRGSSSTTVPGAAPSGGDGDETAAEVPGGVVSVTDGGGGGGSGAVVPVAATAGIVAVVGACALRARRRRTAVGDIGEA